MVVQAWDDVSSFSCRLQNLCALFQQQQRFRRGFCFAVNLKFRVLKATIRRFALPFQGISCRDHSKPHTIRGNALKHILLASLQWNLNNAISKKMAQNSLESGWWDCIHASESFAHPGKSCCLLRKSCLVSLPAQQERVSVFSAMVCRDVRDNLAQLISRQKRPAKIHIQQGNKRDLSCELYPPKLIRSTKQRQSCVY